MLLLPPVKEAQLEQSLPLTPKSAPRKRPSADFEGTRWAKAGTADVEAEAEAEVALGVEDVRVEVSAEGKGNVEVVRRVEKEGTGEETALCVV